MSKRLLNDLVLAPSAGRGALAIAGESLVCTPYFELAASGGLAGGVFLNWIDAIASRFRAEGGAWKNHAQNFGRGNRNYKHVHFYSYYMYN